MEGCGHLQTLNGLTKDASELHYGRCNIVKLSLHTTLVWLWNLRSSSLIQCSTVDLCQYVYWAYSIGISVGDSQGDDVVTSQACTRLYVQYLEYYYYY